MKQKNRRPRWRLYSKNRGSVRIYPNNYMRFLTFDTDKQQELDINVVTHKVR